LLLVAHRPPTTGARCAALAELGVGGFEVDVQLAADGAVVVSHYLPFLRVRGWFEHDNWRFRWRSGPPHDALLEDVVELVPPDRLILLDPKDTAPRRRAQLISALAAMLTSRDRFRVSTDRLEDLEQYRAAGFATWRTIKDSGGLSRALAGSPLPDAGVSVRHTLLTEASTRALHDVVGTVVAWTVNDVARARQLCEFGVDGITTDERDVVSELSD
jgi:glycerophosphoryl diester phosphodiesterase